MEVHDVLADEVVQLRVAVALQEIEHIQARALAVHLQAAQVADRRIQPDVEVLAGVPGNLEAEVGRVTRDVPVRGCHLRLEPFLQLGLDGRYGDVAGSHLRRNPSNWPASKKKCSESRSSGSAPLSTERGSFRSVGA